MSMKKNKDKTANQRKYFNKVQEYVSLEYSEELKEKMCSPKYLNIAFSYSNNCLSLNKPVPFTANEIVRFISKTN